jgi:hypothetical protein
LTNVCLESSRNSLPGHECATVPEAGLAGRKNGQLLSLAESEGFDVFLTLDKGIEYQQNLTERKISIIIVRAKSNRLRDIQPFAQECLAQMRNIAPGQTCTRGQVLRSMTLRPHTPLVAASGLPAGARGICHDGPKRHEKGFSDYRRIVPR